MPQTPPRSDSRFRLMALPVLVVLLPLLFSIVSPLFARDSGAVREFLERPDPQHTSCVRDTTYMRFHHWELLRGLREEVVRDGIRGDLSLDGCWDCHQSKVRFCDRCHKAASVRPDCFGCHYHPDVEESLLER